MIHCIIIISRPLSSMSIPELKDAVQHHDVIYALVHDGLDATLQVSIFIRSSPLVDLNLLRIMLKRLLSHYMVHQR